MSEFPEIGEKLPEGSKEERERARFLKVTVEELRFLQWYGPYREWWIRGKKSSPSD